jgi:hypothetical protein
VYLERAFIFSITFFKQFFSLFARTWRSLITFDITSFTTEMQLISLLMLQEEYQHVKVEDEIRHNSVGTATSYGRDCRGIRVRFPARAKDFSLCHSSTAHPSFCTMGTRGFLPWGVKRPGREDDRLPPSGTQVKNGRSVPKIPHTYLWVGC